MIVFLVLQHPFADLRSLLGAQSARLSRPAWPLVMPGADFVRSFGQVRSRLRGGVEEWAGEESYCLARSAVRFPNYLRTLKLGSGPLESSAYRAFRRFLSDGTVSRAEIGLSLVASGSAAGPASETDLARLLKDCLQLQVFVKAENLQVQPSTLVGCASAIARNYLRATTNRKSLEAIQPWWVSSGSPAVLVESVDSPPLTLTGYARKVFESGGMTLSHDWMQFGAHKCSTWFIEATSPHPDSLRRLRIHLMRLHAERECLRLVLIRINENKLSLNRNAETSDLAQEYLNEAIRVLEKKERFGMPQSEMLDAAQHALSAAIPGYAASLDQMRRQVAAKVRGYVRRAENSTNITKVYGDQMNVTTNISMGTANIQGNFEVITAKNIENSFNKAAAADVNVELKTRLKELSVEVAKLAATLPPEAAQAVSNDLQTLTSEAISKEPRKKWYELSAEGLVDAAKAVAEMAGPISTAVGAVLALLP